MKKEKVVVLVPIYNDWDSFFVLSNKVNNLFASIYDITIVAVNDGSNENNNKELPKNVFVLELVRNLGHQRAIAVGLSYCSENYIFDYCVVMDGDGEDKPEDIEELINEAKLKSCIIFARRHKRKDSLWFKLFYKLYKICFKLLTGKTINFGNFSVLPVDSLNKIIYFHEIWNNYCGGVMLSRLPYASVLISKGSRYEGKSKMNFVSLILHGFGAMSVFIDRIMTRIIIFSIVSVITFLLVALFILYIKFFTYLAIPGWATSVIVGLTIIFLLILLQSFSMIFILIVYNSLPHIIPKKDYKNFIV